MLRRTHKPSLRCIATQRKQIFAHAVSRPDFLSVLKVSRGSREAGNDLTKRDGFSFVTGRATP